MTGSSQFTVSTASSDDWSYIDELQQLYFPDDPTQVDQCEFDTLCTGDGGSILVARCQRLFAGHIVMRRRTILPWESIAFLAVDPRFRRSGLGSLLTRTAISNSQRPFMRLHVRPSNLAALSIYRELGFRAVGRKHGNYDDGEDALVMMCWTGLSMTPGREVSKRDDIAA